MIGCGLTRVSACSICSFTIMAFLIRNDEMGAGAFQHNTLVQFVRVLLLPSWPCSTRISLVPNTKLTLTRAVGCIDKRSSAELSEAINSSANHPDSGQ